MSGAERWNERHAAAIAEGRADRPPADWVFEHDGRLQAQPRGRALDVACGRGRNALHLARMGFEVDALDVSDVAIAHLRSRAAAEGLPVRARVADVEAEPLPPGPYQVVLNTFFLERSIFPALKAALAPRGLLLFVAFLPAGDGRASWSLRPGELRAAFSDLEILDYREGPPVPGDRPRASLLARAPGRASDDRPTVAGAASGVAARSR